MVGVSTNHLRRRNGPWQRRLGVLWRLALCASLLAGVTASADEHSSFQPADRISVERHNNVLELSWSDTEERLQGSILPDTPRDGTPVKVTLHVGSFDGEAFDGPLTLTLREAGATHGQTVTVKREPGAVNWRAEFTPETTGPYQLDVSFRTTRHKSLHADFEVVSPPVPRFFLWAIVGLAATTALGYGIRSLVRKDPTEEPPPPASTPEASSPASPPAEAAPAPAPEKPTPL